MCSWHGFQFILLDMSLADVCCILSIFCLENPKLFWEKFLKSIARWAWCRNASCVLPIFGPMDPFDRPCRCCSKFAVKLPQLSIHWFTWATKTLSLRSNGMTSHPLIRGLQAMTYVCFLSISGLRPPGLRPSEESGVAVLAGRMS